MTIKISSRTVINRQQTEVWNFIANFDNAPLWMPGVNLVKQLDEGELGRGSTLQFELRDGSDQQLVSYWEPGKSFTLSYDQASNSSDSSYKLESQADKTVLNLDISLKTQGVRLLLLPFTIWSIKSNASKRLENIKRSLEVDSNQV